MSSNRLLHYLRDFIRRQGGGGGVSDGQLLERFLKERDETAFEVLVWRHGPMVLALAQRILGNVHDAEDVLQATFLTLVRKAGSIGKSEALSSWLYKVAYRIAVRAHLHARKRAERLRIEDVPATDESEESVWRELRPLLDAAIERLPEKYRTAIVLCDLQGKTHREAAEQLGCSAGTISTRVARARQLLRKRLAHHGLAVTLGVLSAALAQRTSAALTASTVRAAVRLVSAGGAEGMISARVAELMEGANQTMSMSRFKIVMFVAVAVGAVAVGVASRAALRKELPTPSVEAPPAEAKTKTPAKKSSDAVTVRGRVLDPEGRPVKGARLYWPRMSTESRSEEDIEIPQRAKTDAEGRFQFELPRSDIHAEWPLALIAAADGYGMDWCELAKGGSPADLTLRLVKDQPIEGRIVSTEGKPLVGIRVRATTATKMSPGQLNDFLTAWKRDWQTVLGQQKAPQSMLLPPDEKSTQAVTDKDGRFRITAVGSGRLVFLRVRDPGLTPTVLHVINRAGFDPAPINKIVLEHTPSDERRLMPPTLLYGPTMVYVAPAGRHIEGTVREAGTGKPVPGFVISCNVGYGDSVRAVADKEGRYRLENIPKKEQYFLIAAPPANSSWLHAGAQVKDKEGLQPLKVDFTAARGILLKGRILDRSTGKGVRGVVRSVPLPGNKFAAQPGADSYRYQGTASGTDGRFQLAIIPGLCVLMVQAYAQDKTKDGQQVNPYKQAEFDAEDREKVKATDDGTGNRFFTTVDNTVEFLSIENAAKVLDLAPDADTASCDLFVERGQTRSIRIEDVDGKPLKGTTVAGVTASWPITFAIPDATCTIFALDPKKPRHLLFYHAATNLAGTLTLRGDEKEPPVVRLGRAGSARGRILDRDGQPLAGADIQLSAPDQIAREFYRQLQQRQQPIRTDKEGRFRVEGIVPQVKFTLGITKGRTSFVGEPRIGVKQVKPGETLDLGDVRVKPAR